MTNENNKKHAAWEESTKNCTSDVALTFDDDRFGGRQATLFVKGTGTIDIPASQGKNFLSVVKKLKDSDFK